MEKWVTERRDSGQLEPLIEAIKNTSQRVMERKIRKKYL